MRYIKTQGLVFAAAVAMAMSATASATTVTSPTGTGYTGSLAAESEGGGIVLHGAQGSFSCTSKGEGKVEEHGLSVTAKGKIATWAFSNCSSNAVVTVKKMGTLEIHATSGGNGTVTSTGAEVESVVPGWATCIYTTNNTQIGTLTGSSSTNATLHAESSPVPRSGGSFLCGTTGVLTGSYLITNPKTLFVE